MKIDNPTISRIIEPLLPDIHQRETSYEVDTSEVDDELLAIFLEQMDIDMQAFNQAIQAGDILLAASKAHSIKGMGGTAGTPALSALAAETESVGKRGDHDRFHEFARCLNTCFDHVKRMIQA